jgi:2-octaprenyl-6-methoxyphenol hydroxylase
MSGQPLVDVTIAGAGPVGSTLALLLAARGITARLIDPGPAPEGGGSIARPIALSQASVDMLCALGTFEPAHATAIRSVHVSQAGAPGRTLMQAADLGLDALGQAVEAAHLAQMFARRTAACVERGQVQSWSASAGHVDVAWADAAGGLRQLRTRLLVIAEGAGQGMLRRSERDYAQHALVGSVRPAVPHEGVAYERFLPGGPLALLPFGERYAVVWTLPSERAQELLALEPQVFLARLQESFGWRRARLSEPGERAIFPLQLRRAEDAGPGVLAIGNAAQTLHPVAGQGLNLGLRDAAVLADCIAAAEPAALGGADFCRHYRRLRSADRGASVLVTDGLVRAFGVQLPGARMLRGAALGLLDAVPAARRFLARRMILGVR